MKRILMISEGPFPEDPRVKNEAYTLTEAGYKVFFLGINLTRRKFKEIVNGVTVYRLPHLNIFEKSDLFRSNKDGSIKHDIFYKMKSSIGYIVEYLYFTIFAFLASLYLVTREKIDIIHLHNPPNTPFLIGVFYKLFGKRFVFDHHDLAPELYLAKYGKKQNSLYRMLMAEESSCLKSANLVIATNESYKRIEIERGKIHPGKIIVVRNGPDLRDFNPVEPDRELLR